MKSSRLLAVEDLRVAFRGDEGEAQVDVPEHTAEEHAEGGGDEADRQGDAAAVHDLGKQVATKNIRTQPVRGRGRHEDLRQRNPIGLDFDNRYRDRSTIIRKNSGHTDFSSYQTERHCQTSKIISGRI